MKKTNTSMFYENSESSLVNLNNNTVPTSVFRQELVTWEHTENGIKRTTVVRNFSDDKNTDSYTSEPIAFKRKVWWKINKFLLWI